MKVKRISIFKEFHCIGAKCPANCCRGWKIPLDDEVCERYRNEKERFGPLFWFSVKEDEDISTFRNIFGRCPFWGKDHLCSLQKKYGAEYMPQVCRQFPRYFSNLGFFCEETLSLGCPESAGLFLVRAGKGEHFDFEETQEDIAYEMSTTNDDEDFLEYLLTAREQLIGLLDGECCFDSMAIVQYGRDAQESCLSGKTLPSPLHYQDKGEIRLEIDCAVLNKLFFGGFYHPRLKIYSPFLYQLCRKYKREFQGLSNINMEAANRKLKALKEGLFDKLPRLELIFNRYYEYYLQSEFLNIFEDYSFSKCLLFGMAKVHMLWVLIALYAKDKKCVSEEEIAKIIAVYERRAPLVKGELEKYLPQVVKDKLL